jgi:hypothetical protein
VFYFNCISFSGYGAVILAAHFGEEVIRKCGIFVFVRVFICLIFALRSS